MLSCHQQYLQQQKHKQNSKDHACVKMATKSQGQQLSAATPAEDSYLSDEHAMLCTTAKSVLETHAGAGCACHC
jgi:hypothetical protein